MASGLKSSNILNRQWLCLGPSGNEFLFIRSKYILFLQWGPLDVSLHIIISTYLRLGKIINNAISGVHSSWPGCQGGFPLLVLIRLVLWCWLVLAVVLLWGWVIARWWWCGKKCVAKKWKGLRAFCVGIGIGSPLRDSFAGRMTDVTLRFRAWLEGGTLEGYKIG